MWPTSGKDKVIGEEIWRRLGHSYTYCKDCGFTVRWFLSDGVSASHDIAQRDDMWWLCDKYVMGEWVDVEALIGPFKSEDDARAAMWMLQEMQPDD